MFYHLKGTVAEIAQGMAVIECGGIGFGVNTSMNTLSQLKTGAETKLYISEQVREDAFELYGFTTLAERNCFDMLISVSGVGPKAAVSILSANTPEGVCMAIMSGNEKALTVAQGIGKKIVAASTALTFIDTEAAPKDVIATELSRLSSSKASLIKLMSSPPT